MYLIEMGKTIMNFKKAFGVAAATMMSAAALTGCATAKTSSTAGNKPSDNTIRIGVNLELSGSAASYGQQEKKGVVLAAQEINKKGVKIGGKTYKVKLYISDNKSSTSTAASVAAQMANSDKIVAQVVPAATPYATSSIANLTKSGVPMVGPSATASEFTQTKSGQTQKYAFRACFIDPFQGKKAADFMYNTLKKSVAILADNSTDYGTGLTKSFNKKFKMLGGKVVTTQYFQSGDKDFNSTLTTIVTVNFIHSRDGRAVISIRENEIAAEAMGVNTALQSLGVLRMVFCAVALIIIMIFKPGGLFGKWEFSFKRLLTKKQDAATLSGGEQQMLAMARALMARPKLLLLDEPSMGLAPIYIQEIFDIIKSINKEGMTVLLIEQNARQALSIANRGYVLASGEVKMTGSGQDLLNDPAVQKAYLGG